MRNFAMRLLAFCSLLLAVWSATGWLSHPQLPANSDAEFPPVALMVFEDSHHEPTQAVASTAGFVTIAVTILLAAALAAWLAWRGSNRPALRDLVIAMALGSIATGWFWFLRPWPAPWFAGVIPALDYVFALAWVAASWAILNCFTAYPEPISRDLLRRNSAAAYETHPARVRAGEGFYRFWSWLPPERYGVHGRTNAPELIGAARFLRSRELLWIVAYAAIGLALFSVFPKTLGASTENLPVWLRVICSAGLALALLFVIDPMFGARENEVLKSVLKEWVTDGNSGMALMQLLTGWRGLVIAIAVALAGTWCWHNAWGGAANQLLFAWVGCGGAIALCILRINWLHGNAEQRRAISWIFLGTVGACMLWLAIQLGASVGMLFTMWKSDPRNNLWLNVIGANLAIGPALVALVFVLSLWASILSRGSFDPALALRKGAGVVALGVVLTALFVAVEGAASSLIVTHLGMPSASGPVVAGTVVALGFKPLRERVENSVQRAMLRLLPADAVADGERRICAVLFCDLSGYTRLSETDEKDALMLAAILHRHARASASAHVGRVVKTIGDAVLCVFDDATQALRAAADLNRGYHEEAAKNALEALPLHSGLHVGEVVVARDGDVFGASVNLAARLQGLAGADELVASNSAAGAIAAAAIPAEPLPARRFKNIAEPVDCLRLRLA